MVVPAERALGITRLAPQHRRGNRGPRSLANLGSQDKPGPSRNPNPGPAAQSGPLGLRCLGFSECRDGGWGASAGAAFTRVSWRGEGSVPLGPATLNVHPLSL